MNGSEAVTLEVPLAFLGSTSHGWRLREFADGPDAAKSETVVETTRDLGGARTLTLRLQPSGGYTAVVSPE